MPNTQRWAHSFSAPPSQFALRKSLDSQRTNTAGHDSHNKQETSRQRWEEWVLWTGWRKAKQKNWPPLELVGLSDKCFLNLCHVQTTLQPQTDPPLHMDSVSYCTCLSPSSSPLWASSNSEVQENTWIQSVMLSVRLSSLASVWLTDSRVTKPTEAWWLKNNNPFVTRDSVGQQSG